MLYREAARIVRDASEKKGSAKNLILSSKYKNKKLLYALVLETLKFTSIINDIIESSKLQKLEKCLMKDTNLCQVLVYDLLFGKGLKEKGPHQEAVLRHKAALGAELARRKIKAKASSNAELLGDSAKQNETLPRYVRVNTLKTTVEDVISHFKTEGYVNTPSYGGGYERYLDVVRGLSGKQMTVDLHIPELLVFPAGTDLHDHVLYKRGDIIFQDKASCLPAFLLDPPPGSHVIDCCAAPGNKTTHLAAILGNKGKVFSFDKDAKRLGTMNTMTLRAGVLCAELHHQDFLKVKHDDPKYAKVEYVLVDPSCSGSGIVNRMNDSTDDTDSASRERLQRLANFQTLILKHAMTFPKVRRLLYSTCSTHIAENEAVVATVMEETGDMYTLKKVLAEFPHRGKSEDNDLEPSQSEACIRTSPADDLTNGFFVTCFERNPNSSAPSVQDENLKKDEVTTEVSSDSGKIKKSKKRKADQNTPENETNTPLPSQPSKVKTDKHRKESSKSVGTKHTNGDDPQITQDKKNKKNKKQKSSDQVTLGSEDQTSSIAKTSKSEHTSDSQVMSSTTKSQSSEGQVKKKRQKKKKRKHTPVTQ